MRRLLPLILLLFSVAAQAQREPDARSLDGWNQVVMSDGKPLANPASTVLVAGRPFVACGQPDDSGNFYWAVLEKGRAAFIKTGNGDWFRARAPFAACGVVLAGQRVKEVVGGIRYFRVSGALAEPLTTADGKPFIITPDGGDSGATPIPGPGVCPYFRVNTRDSTSMIIRLDGLVAGVVSQPKGLSMRRYAWTGKQLLLTGSKSYLLDEKATVEIKDAAGADVSTTSTLEPMCTGEYVLINPGQGVRTRLYRLAGAVATLIAAPANHVFMLLQGGGAAVHVMTCDVADPKAFKYQMHELKDGKLSPLATLEKWKNRRLAKVREFEAARVLEFGDASSGMWLVLLQGAQAAELFSTDSESRPQILQFVAGPVDGWLLEISASSEPELWHLRRGKAPSRITRPKGVSSFLLCQGDSGGFYAHIELGGNDTFFAYRAQ